MSMVTPHNRRIPYLPLLPVAFLCACQANIESPNSNGVTEASLCDLRNNPERFGGKTIKVEGWIYTDTERFTLSNGDCSIGLLWPDAKPSGQQTKQFEALVEASKKGGFNSDQEVFASFVGRFLTVETKIGSETWTPGYGHGQSPSVLLIDRAVCSTVAPMSRNTQAEAHARCKPGFAPSR